MKRKNRAKQSQQVKKIQNRRARHDYQLQDELIVGVQLSGKETKALRLGRGQLRGAFVNIINGELWLINATISSGGTFEIPENEQTRSRKLLAKQREINNLIAAKQQGKTIVPIEFLTQGKFIKLKIAVGKGKKRWGKRQTLKKRDQDLEARRQLTTR